MKTLILLTILFTPVTLFSQGSQGFQFLVTHENDFLALGNKDDNYTGGIKIEVLTPGFKKNFLPFYRFKGSNVMNLQRYAIGGTGYTPQDIGTDEIQYGDRPYASLLFGSFGTVSYSNSRKVSISSEIMGGCIGCEGAGNFQAFLHRNHAGGSTRPIPEGWDHQIAYDGKFVLNYSVRVQSLFWHSHRAVANRIKANNFAEDKKAELVRGKLIDTSIDLVTMDKITLSDNLHDALTFEWVQLNWTAGADVGNYMVNLLAGLKVNLLNFNTNPLLNYDPNIIKLFEEKDSSKRRKQNLRFNLFAEPSLRLAIYNSTLEGMMINDHSDYTIDHTDVRRILFEMNAGVNMLLFNCLYLRYTYSLRSQEFEDGKQFHNWGGVTIGFSPKKWNKQNL